MPPSRVEIEQEIRRRQARFSQARKQALLEDDPSRSALSPQEEETINAPLTRYWSARNSDKPVQSRGPLRGALTLPQVAESLGCSEKTVQRLIKTRKIIANKTSLQGKKRWVIERWALNRYKLLKQVDRQFRAEVPFLENIQGFGVRFAFTSQKGNYRGVPRVSLSVSLEDFWRFACKPKRTRQEYEAIKEEIRSRINNSPKDFLIQFRFDVNEVVPTLERIIKSVKNVPTSLQGKDRQDLQQEALIHLMRNVLPHLRQIEQSWVAYLRQSVKNFYTDQARKSDRFLYFTDTDVETQPDSQDD